MNSQLSGAGRVSVLLLVAAVVLGASADAPYAQDVSESPVAGAIQQDIQSKRLDSTAASRKVSSKLRSVLSEIKARGITRENARTLGASALSNPFVRVSEDGGIHVYIHVSTLGPNEEATLERHEVMIEIANEELGIVQAWIPSDRIDDVAALPFVTRITPPSYGTPRTGSVTTEGDAILNADQLRALGVDGTGVKVGVISDGANSRADAQATGDLPPGITVFGTCSIVGPGDCDEGTAMMEIIHDLAPGAALGVGAVSTNLEFIERITDLVDTFGADVVVDDLGFFGEPFFEDGPIAQAVAAVTGALAVGAIDAFDPGNDDIEFFSSLGPSQIFFPAPDTRQKPDLTAIDGVSVTGASGFPSTFFGTSASAPHVAGVVALLKSGSARARAVDILNALKGSAVDLGAAGPDNVFGAGRVDALAADERLTALVSGLWVRMNNSFWVQLNAISPESMVTGDMDGN